MNKQMKDLLKMNNDELQKELVTARESLFKLKFQKVVDDMKDKSVFKKNRKKAARILTILKQRELDKQQQSQTK